MTEILINKKELTGGRDGKGRCRWQYDDGGIRPSAAQSVKCASWKGRGDVSHNDVLVRKGAL